MTTTTTGAIDVIAHGVFTDFGVVHPGAKVDTWVLQKGSFHLAHKVTSTTHHLNPVTCLDQLSQTGTYTLSHGTGKYTRISGSGKFVFSQLAIEARAWANTDWMKGLLVLVPDGSYAVQSFATDHKRNNVCAYAVFSGTHSAEGGPMPPTGKSTSSDYVYVMEFEGGKISHMTKIWNAGWAMKELGWIE